MVALAPHELDSALFTAPAADASGLHPSTAPAAIAADQRAAVLAAVRKLRKADRTPERLSDLTDLPVFTVRRRLNEINGVANGPVAMKRRTLASRVAEAIRGHGPMTVLEVAERIGVAAKAVNMALGNPMARVRNGFHAAGVRVGHNKRRVTVWGVRGSNS